MGSCFLGLVSFLFFRLWAGPANNQAGLVTVRTAGLFAAALTWVVLCTVHPANAVSDYFIGKITVQLCPQYHDGNTEIELDYAVGGSGARAVLPIVSKEVAPGAPTGVFRFKLPNFMGTTPFNIRAFCVSSGRYSRPSNSAVLSNCNALAARDDDYDGLANNLEDTDCSNFFSPGDRSNPDNVDTDGDGARDLVEVTSKTDPSNPGSSPRPTIFSGGPIDPDGDGSSNPIVWRAAQGMWYVRDMFTPGNHLGLQWGLPGDTPFAYNPAGGTTNVGVIRNINDSLYWFFRGPGVQDANGNWANVIPFGLFGDNIVLGPWEVPGMTSPAVARLFNGHWTFFILRRDGSTRIVVWGGNGDVPKPQDYDGDGLFDVAVYRPAAGTSYVIRSSDGNGGIYRFGTGTADHTVRGDFSGDGIDDISFWEPLTGMFNSLKSDMGFNSEAGLRGVEGYSEQIQLGLYFVHVPLSYNRHSGQDWFTVVDHATGLRYFRPENIPFHQPEAIQWGLAGDSQG